jgi:hypothetical protein
MRPECGSQITIVDDAHTQVPLKTLVKNVLSGNQYSKLDGSEWQSDNPAHAEKTYAEGVFDEI